MKARPRPVLMIPLRRCGSHALRLRLGLNPQCYAPYPLHVVDLMPALPLYGDLDDDRAYFQLVVDVVGLQAASLVKWPDAAFDPVEVFDAIRDQPRSVHRVTWELLLRGAERRGARVALDKSLDSVHYAAEQLALFPDLRFVNVVRDPRAQVASMNAAVIHDFDTLLNTRTWVRAHEAGRALAAAHPERVLTVRYEDFLADDEHTLRAICAFLDIDFLPAMRDVSTSSEARQISRLSALWSSNTLPPVPANADKFRSTLRLPEIEVIETLAGGLMDHYGYPRMTAASAPAAALDVDAAAIRSERERLRSWEALERTNHRDHTLRTFRGDYLATVQSRLRRRTPAAVQATPG
ncbi:sulfotransferase family protein [Phytohabitans flavus]|uniref:sulfotransferase family protein n=1 Tax=Phytohabitans flavus TaxID=1076124 RepID=UPI0018DA1872|nr:sulfotransferase [Phytohabitans flavus]